MINPSASQLDRVVACPKSHQLTQSKSASSFADDGRKVHEFLAAFATGTAYKEAAELLPESSKEAYLRWSFAPLEQPEAEVSFLYNPAQNSVRRVDKKYREIVQTKEELGCTVDLLGYRNGCVALLDWKTGMSAPKASETWQLKLAALCLAAETKAKAVTVGIIHTFGGVPKQDWVTYSSLELEFFRADLIELLQKLTTTQEAYSEGEHCRYCPALRFCEPKLALLKAVANGDLPTSYEKILEAEKLLSKAKEDLKLHAGQEPVALVGGKYLTMAEQQGAQLFDKKRALELLKEKGAQPEELESCYKKAGSFFKMKTYTQKQEGAE